jgi:peptidoglycan-N-acetylglucosamine deacetylase
MKTSTRLAAAGGAAAAGAVLVHLLPAVTTWRELRCWATPALAGVGDAGHVALTFDDGPDPSSTPAILDELDRLGWRATFFLLGPMVRRSPSLAAELVSRGHEVGVHGDEHRSHLHRTPGAVRGDVTRARDSIVEATGAESVWFRPPYGALSAGSLTAAHQLGLRPVLWTTWGRDWRAEATGSTVVADVAHGLRPGATVLLHDSDGTSAPCPRWPSCSRRTACPWARSASTASGPLRPAAFMPGVPGVPAELGGPGAGPRRGCRLPSR